MWGNRLGWLMSAAIVIVVTGSLYLIYLAAAATHPTDFVNHPENLSVGDLQYASIYKPSSDCDAGEKYAAALKDYEAHKFDYKRKRASDVANLPCVKLALEAGDCSKMTLFKPEELITYDNTREDKLHALRNIGRFLSQVALLEQSEKKNDEAKKYFQAEFALAEHLYEERLSFAEMQTGLELLHEAAKGMAMLDPANAAQFNDLIAQTGKLNSKDGVFRTYSFLASPDGQTTIEHAGDTFWVATHTSVDRVWRVEAILKLGRMRWYIADEGGSVGDQTETTRTLHRLQSSDNDPVIQTAVKAALDLTADGFHLWNSNLEQQ